MKMAKLSLLLIVIAITVAYANAELYQSDDGLIKVKPVDYNVKTTSMLNGKTVDIYKYSNNVKLEINSSLEEVHIEIYNESDLVYYNFTNHPTLLNLSLKKGNYTVFVGACGYICNYYSCKEICSEFNSYGKFIINVDKNVSRINQNQSKLIVKSTFNNYSSIPRKYAFFYCGGQNINPPLYLKNLSNKAKSIVIVVEDPDANNFLHWLAWNVEPTETIPENIPKKRIVNYPKMIQGTNDFGSVGYGGPCPPIGERHRYYFKVYVLDTTLNLPITATKEDVFKAMKGHVIQEGLLIGTFP